MFAPTLSIEAARRQLADMLRSDGVAAADLDARLLVCAASGIDHIALIRSPDMPLGRAAPRLAAYVQRRLAREPVARILGRREFWGLSLHVNAAVLDPRADTETLVASVLDAIGPRRVAPFELLDLGTGSGAILCALLSELAQAHGVGVDRSIEACLTAAGNLSALGLAGRASIVCGAWGESLRGRFDIVVANPPYIARGDIAELAADVRAYDPIGALDGGVDGLDAYRAIAPTVGALLSPDGIAAFECGWNQGTQVVALMRDAGLRGLRTCKDVSGNDRVVLGAAAG